MTCLSPNAVLPLAVAEGLVPEAYKDSEGIWTWALGVTDKSGHLVQRYKDNPQPLEKCVEVSVWLLKKSYLPHVLKAFQGHDLTESELAAALSFHWNTGAILTTSWVKLFLAGKKKEARAFLENHYLNGGDLKSRRMWEAALFFDGKWPAETLVPVYGVAKPSYRPKGAKKVDIRPMLEKALA